MDCTLLFLSTERTSVTYHQQLQAAIKQLQTANPLRTVNLASISIRDFVNNPECIDVKSHWHQWQNCDVPPDLLLSQEENSTEDETQFRYNDFYAVASCLHKFADQFHESGNGYLYVLWCVDAYAPNPSEVTEFYGALLRLQLWHSGGIYIITDNLEMVKEWPDFLPMSVTSSAAKVVKDAADILWRGNLVVTQNDGDGSYSFPECQILCNHGVQLFSAKEDFKYFLPTAEIVADFDVCTVPWPYIRLGSVYTMAACEHRDKAEQEEVTSLLESLTSQAGMATLVRLHYSSERPDLDGVSALTTSEWERIHAEGRFDISPLFIFRGSRQVLNVLVLSDVSSIGQIQVVALQDLSACGDDVINLLLSSNATKYDTDTQNLRHIEENMASLLRDSTMFTCVQMASLSHLCLHFSKMIISQFAKKGKQWQDLDENLLLEIDTATSRAVLQALLELSGSPIHLPEKVLDIVPETSTSICKWPEYITLTEYESCRSSLRRLSSSNETLGGLAPPAPPHTIFSLTAGQLTPLFSENGSPAVKVKQKMAKHVPARKQNTFKSLQCLEEVKPMLWPDSAYVKHHGIYYNMDERGELLDTRCNNLSGRYIRHETAATCTIFQEKGTYVTVCERRNEKTPAVIVQTTKRKHETSLKKSCVETVSRLRNILDDVDSVSICSGRQFRASVRKSGKDASGAEFEVGLQKLPHPSSSDGGFRRSPRKHDKKGSVKPSDLLKSLSRFSPRIVAKSADRKVPKPATMSLLHTKKLRIAVVEALETQGVRLKDPLFKLCFKKLFTICVPFALDVIGQGSTSKNLEHIARDHVKQVVKFERHKVKRV